MVDSLIARLKKLLRCHSESPTIQQSRGRLGEDLAVRYLKKNTPCSILLRNWSDGRHEIDIICREGDTLVFVEVRARNASALVSGYASVNSGKRKSLRLAALNYIKTLPQHPHTYRYDVVELGMEGDEAKHIRYFKNVKVF